MLDNVVVVIGDNGTGKTRHLKQVRRECIDKGLTVISNFYNSYYEADHRKVDVVLEEGKEYMGEILTKSAAVIDLYFQDLLQLMTSKGDVLIIDGLDRKLSLQGILDFCIVLSQLRDCWEKIIVSGYNSALLRIFTYFTYDSDGYKEREETLVNLLYLTKVVSSNL